MYAFENQGQLVLFTEKFENQVEDLESKMAMIARGQDPYQVAAAASSADEPGGKLRQTHLLVFDTNYLLLSRKISRNKGRNLRNKTSSNKTPRQTKTAPTPNKEVMKRGKTKKKNRKKREIYKVKLLPTT